MQAAAPPRPNLSPEGRGVGERNCHALTRKVGQCQTPRQADYPETFPAGALRNGAAARGGFMRSFNGPGTSAAYGENGMAANSLSLGTLTAVGLAPARRNAVPA